MGMDEADHPSRSQCSEGMVQRRPGGLGGKSPSPIRAPEDPPYLQAGPSLRQPKSCAPDEFPGVPPDYRPLPELTQTPMANEERHLAPGSGPLERATVAQVAPDFWVGADRGVRIEVRELQSAQQ